MVEVRGRLEVGRRQKMTSARELQKLVQVHCSVSEEYTMSLNKKIDTKTLALHPTTCLMIFAELPAQ